MTPPADLERIANALAAAAARLVPGATPLVALEPPRNPAFGEYATNVALQLAKTARRPPQALATELAAALFVEDPGLAETVASAEAIGGFVNLRLAPGYWRRLAGRILAEGEAFGRGAPTGTRISLEFGSANPTGPLVVVQGRTLAVGAALAAAMRFVGHDATCEWIINDAGSQLETLGRSLYARYRQIDDPAYPFPEDGYPGDYLPPIAAILRARDGDAWDAAPEATVLSHFAQAGRDALVAQQAQTCARFGVAYDLWQSERALHDAGKVTDGIAALRTAGYVYEAEDATWFRATAFGDDKDRVLVRRDGRPSYVAGDVAYHYDKFRRGANRVIDILGPDHHGYIARLRAIAAAFDRPGDLEVLIAQQMTLVRDGEIVPLSKRAGNVLTLDDVINEVGVDAARFFFVMLSLDHPLTFDLALAKEKSAENPVFYVQYGHARIASIERKAAPELLRRARTAGAAELAPLGDPAEIALIRTLAEFPGAVRSVVAGLAPHRLARYAREVAAQFHQFYMACVVLGPDEELTVARLALARATKLVLASALGLLGVSAPERMDRATEDPEERDDGERAPS